MKVPEDKIVPARVEWVVRKWCRGWRAVVDCGFLGDIREGCNYTGHVAIWEKRLCEVFLSLPSMLKSKSLWANSVRNVCRLFQVKSNQVKSEYSQAIWLQVQLHITSHMTVSIVQYSIQQRCAKSSRHPCSHWSQCAETGGKGPRQEALLTTLLWLHISVENRHLRPRARLLEATSIHCFLLVSPSCTWLLSNCYGSNAFVFIVGWFVRLSRDPIALGLIVVRNTKESPFNLCLEVQERRSHFTVSV